MSKVTGQREAAGVGGGQTLRSMPTFNQKQQAASVTDTGKMSNTQKRALYWLIAAVAYLICPLDGDWFLLYFDDAIFLYWAYKNYRQQKSQGNEPIMQFGYRRDEPVEAEIVEEEEWTPRRSCPPQLPVEEPGFFTRLFKAILYIINGGAL
jgi:hypothetical protein